MSWWGGPKYFKDRTRKILGLDRISEINGPMVLAGIQAAGGAALAYYLIKKSEYQTLPYMCSAVAVIGTCKFFRIMQKENRKEEGSRLMKHQSAWNLPAGIFTYFTNVYAFSEGLKHNDKMWILSLAIAASGYYFSVAYIDSLEAGPNKKTFLICSQRMFEPILIVATATYLLHFRNHKEDYLYLIPFVCITASGFKISTQGFARAENALIPKQLLLRAVEMLMGGSLMTAGSIVLTVYTSVNGFNTLCIISAAVTSLFGGFIIFGSTTCLRRYLGLDVNVFFAIVGLIAGPITFLGSCLMVLCVNDAFLVFIICMFLAGLGHVLVLRSVVRLYLLVPEPVVYMYCQRVLGPVLIVYSILATAWVCYRMGWRFALATMPFIPAGIYATHKGFSRGQELQ